MKHYYIIYLYLINHTDSVSDETLREKVLNPTSETRIIKLHYFKS